MLNKFKSWLCSANAPRLPCIYLLLLVPPFAVFGISDSLLFHFATPPVIAGSGDLNALGRSTTFIDVVGATLLLFCVCLGIAVYFCCVTRRSGGRLIPIWVAASVSLCLWMRGATDASNRAWRILGDPPNVCPGTPMPGNIGAGCGTDLVNRILDLMTPFILFASVAAILGAISCLAYSAIPQSAREWKRQRNLADTWLLIGSALLVAGLVFHQSWGRWLAGNWALSDSKEFATLVASYTSFKGIQSSLLIASYYIPVVFILSSRTDAIVGKLAAEAGLDKLDAIEAELDLAVPVSGLVKSIGGILAPFLASLLGPAADLLKHAAG